MSDKLSTPPRNSQSSTNSASEPRPPRPSPLRQSSTSSAELGNERPPAWTRPTSYSAQRPPPIGSGRPSNLSQTRRTLSGSSSIFGSARTVSFPDNPVTMSQSPPQVSPTSTSSESTPLRGRSESRSASLPPVIRSSNPSDESTRRSSVKHLTCFWWKEKGSCKYTEEECLYAHYDTGRYTDAPRQLNPDEPAKAGRNLARAIGDLVHQRRVSGSMQLSSPTSSRPGSPLSASGSRTSLPAMIARTRSPLGQEITPNRQDLEEQIELYRKIVETGTKEKAMMLDLIDDLKAKLVAGDAAMRRIQSDKDFIERENQALKAAFQHSVGTNYASVGSVSAVAAPGLGDGLVNSFAGLNVGNIPAWAPSGGAVDRPGTPNTNPSDDGEYLDMRIPGCYRSGN